MHGVSHVVARDGYTKKCSGKFILSVSIREAEDRYD